MTSDLSTVADVPVGTILGDRYVIVRKLGQGGMGTVYLAKHTIIEKPVAIKVLSGDFASKTELMQRFLQEARAAARIGQENIVEVFDFGETEDSVYFAMEYLEGKDLSSVIREVGPMPVGRMCNIVVQICRALGAAHAKGIVHRDLKPENIILIEKEGRHDFVKVLDFGIAKISDDGNTLERLTRAGMIFGTPEYMAPEQASGDVPDRRADIYALGCILYEMLTGTPPFMADSFMKVLTRHMLEAPEPPSQRTSVPIPPGIEEVCLHALEKAPEQRFQTMQEMLTAVESAAAMEDEEEEQPFILEQPTQVRPRPMGPSASPATSQPGLSPSYQSSPQMVPPQPMPAPYQSMPQMVLPQQMPAPYQSMPQMVLPQQMPPPVAQPAPPALAPSLPEVSAPFPLAPPSNPGVPAAVAPAPPAAPRKPGRLRWIAPLAGALSLSAVAGVVILQHRNATPVQKPGPVELVRKEQQPTPPAVQEEPPPANEQQPAPAVAQQTTQKASAPVPPLRVATDEPVVASAPPVAPPPAVPSVPTVVSKHRRSGSSSRKVITAKSGSGTKQESGTKEDPQGDLKDPFKN